MDSTNNKRKKPNLSGDDRKKVVSKCLEASIECDGMRSLRKKDALAIADEFSCSYSTIKRIWSRAKNNYYNNKEVSAFRASPLMKKRCGRKRLYDALDVSLELSKVEENKKQTYRSVSQQLDISAATLWRMFKQNPDLFHKPKVSLIPFLTDENMLVRLHYALNQVETKKVNGEDIFYFDPQYDRVYLDEKWFYITPKTRQLYLSCFEEAKVRRIKNKGHMTKVQFLCAVARPRFQDNDPNKECTFDGLIGLWDFTKVEAAQRKSKNYNRGDPVRKNINIDAATYKRFVLEKVIPRIEEVWPDRRPTYTIKLQHDNARVHFGNDDADFQQLNVDGRRFQFELAEQPANSPDTNILDLCFFNSLQSLQFKEGQAQSMDELIDMVNAAWNRYNPVTLNRSFLTHQSCLDQILCHGGDNHYKMIRPSKDRLYKHGKLVTTMELTEDAAEAYKNYLG